MLFVNSSLTVRIRDAVATVDVEGEAAGTNFDFTANTFAERWVPQFVRLLETEFLFATISTSAETIFAVIIMLRTAVLKLKLKMSFAKTDRNFLHNYFNINNRGKRKKNNLGRDKQLRFMEKLTADLILQLQRHSTCDGSIITSVSRYSNFSVSSL